MFAFRPLQWLWQGQAMRAVAARLAAAEPLRETRQRAQLALQLGQQTEEPSEPFGAAPEPFAARERYREAARCALEALSGGHTRSATEPSDSALLLRAAGGDETRLKRLRAQLAPPLVSNPAPSSAEQEPATAELRAFVTVLVEAACADETALRRLRRQRRQRVALSGALLTFALFRTAQALDGADLRTDLAEGKPWQTSSVAYRCEPHERRCGNHFGMTIFFHTGEDPSPWFQIDLQQEQRISAVRVRNRTDCCSLLAIPLVVELSSDGQTWREVARRERNFRNWAPEFEPTSARWVRLRVDRTSMLHLERVSVYR